MVETRVSSDFADQAVRLAGTKRALASAAMMDLRMQLAAQRDRRALDDFGRFALARPVRVAALLENRPDPLVLAAVAGDRAMRNLAGLSGRDTEGEKLKFTTTLEGLAAKTARDHLELCRSDPAAARRIEARWARQRQPYRSGFLGEPLQAMEATYGAACTVAQDQSQGRRPLMTPPPGWSPTGVMAKARSALPDLEKARAESLVDTAMPEQWNVRRGLRHQGLDRLRTRFVARGGVGRAEQLARRSLVRVPLGRPWMRRRLAASMRKGPEAMRSFLARVASNPRRAATLIKMRIDPVLVAAAIGPKAVEALVSGRPVPEAGNLGKLCEQLVRRDRERLSDAYHAGSPAHRERMLSGGGSPGFRGEVRDFVNRVMDATPRAAERAEDWRDHLYGDKAGDVYAAWQAQRRGLAEGERPEALDPEVGERLRHARTVPDAGDNASSYDTSDWSGDSREIVIEEAVDENRGAAGRKPHRADEALPSQMEIPPSLLRKTPPGPDRPALEPDGAYRWKVEGDPYIESVERRLDGHYVVHFRPGAAEQLAALGDGEDVKLASKVASTAHERLLDPEQQRKDSRGAYERVGVEEATLAALEAGRSTIDQLREHPGPAEAAVVRYDDEGNQRHQVQTGIDGQRLRQWQEDHRQYSPAFVAAGDAERAGCSVPPDAEGVWVTRTVSREVQPFDAQGRIDDRADPVTVRQVVAERVYHVSQLRTRDGSLPAEHFDLPAGRRITDRWNGPDKAGRRAVVDAEDLALGAGVGFSEERGRGPLDSYKKDSMLIERSGEPAEPHSVAKAARAGATVRAVAEAGLDRGLARGERRASIDERLAGDGWERRLVVQVAAERMASRANLAYAPPTAPDDPEERREWVRRMRANPKLYRDIVTRGEKLADNIVRRTLEHPDFDRKPDRYEPPPDRSAGAATDRGRDAGRDLGEGPER